MKQINNDTLGGKIVAARERKSERIGRYTLYRLAKDTNIDHGYLHRIVNNKSLPSREKLIKICHALDCTPEEAAEIFAETDYRSPSPEELENPPEDRYRRKVA